MSPATKIATCCYCGVRSAMVIDKGRHELVCVSCGAPLHNMKHLKTETSDSAKRNLVGKKPAKKTKQAKKKRKSFAKSFLGEAFDLIEDIFD